VLVEYKPTLKYNFEQALSNSIPFEMEYARNTLDGNIKYLHIIGVPILNEKDNTIKEIVGCIQDITDRKLGELKLLEQTQALIETNKKAAEYKLMALRSVMNPHFLFNSLNSIQYFISKNIREKALDYLSQFSKLIRSVLNSSINNTITLAEEIETLRLYTNLESIRFDNFTTVIEVDDNVEISNIEIPSLLLQPYVENAILHGLSQKKEGHGLLNIRFTTDYEKLYITIEDNGIGRKEAQKLKEDQNKLHKSVGMLVTAERLEMINQDDLLAVKIEDKVDENGNSAGTKVHITLNIY
jgi:LytS/YehU family sensor histidine kinase